MKKSKNIIQNNTFTEFLLYTDPNGKVKVEIFLRNENIWLTQAKIAEVFGVDVRTVNEHLQNVYASGELKEDATIRNFRIVQKEGNRQVKRDVELNKIKIMFQTLTVR